MGLYSGGLIIGRIFASEIWGVYFREGLFLGGLIIGILLYISFGYTHLTIQNSEAEVSFRVNSECRCLPNYPLCSFSA